MSLMDKEHFFSWIIDENVQATKRVDKSFYAYGETVIPIGIRRFFEIEKYSKGDVIDIKIIFKDRGYEGKIYFENNFNRSKIKLESELKLGVQECICNSVCKGDYNNNKVIAKFIKYTNKIYYMTLSVEI